MYVITRSGAQEPCRFDKITDRITSLAFGLNPEFCDPVRGAAARGCGVRAASGRRGTPGVRAARHVLALRRAGARSGRTATRLRWP